MRLVRKVVGVGVSLEDVGFSMNSAVSGPLRTAPARKLTVADQLQRFVLFRDFRQPLPVFVFAACLPQMRAAL